MDPVQIAQLFVKYAEAKKTMEDLRAQIETLVLAEGSSMDLAGVKATYYKPSIKVDYEAAARAKGASPTLIKNHSKVTTTVAWKEVLIAMKVDLEKLEAYSREEPARVVIK